MKEANFICPVCGNGNYMRWLPLVLESEYKLKCINCNHYFRPEDLEKRPKKKNIDRLREMSVEEMAGFLRKVAYEGDWKFGDSGVMTKHELVGGVRVPWVDWLEQECEE